MFNDSNDNMLKVLKKKMYIFHIPNIWYLISKGTFGDLDCIIEMLKYYRNVFNKKFDSYLNLHSFAILTIDCFRIPFLKKYE